MRRFIKKGTWYYEMQILMIVIMWKHNMNYKYPKSAAYGFRLGRLEVWYDQAWLYHGVGSKLSSLWASITQPLRNLLLFGKSLRAFILLSRAGFHISSSGFVRRDFWMYRFWWNKRIINDMADIDYVEGKYYTMFYGRSERLDKQ